MDDIDKVFESIQPRYPELAGQVALITGSTQGIGEGIALRLAREGMNVILHGIDEPSVAGAMQRFASVGVDTIGIAANLSHPDAIDRVFETIRNHHNRLDLLVNNAADLRRTNTANTTPERLDYQWSVNLRFPFLCSQQAAALMRSQNSGNIINISSVGGQRAHLPGLPYDVMKGGMDAMTRAMALDLASEGIRVNAIAPGAIRHWKTPPDDHPRVQAQVSRIPVGRLGMPLEIGAAVAFLASDDARYITGHILNVDGGITAQISPPGQFI